MKLLPRPAPVRLTFLSVVLVCSPPLEAFWPTGIGGITGHDDITQKALKDQAFVVAGRTYHFSSDAIRAIVEGNKHVDQRFSECPGCHFDNERFASTSVFIRDSLETAFDAAIDRDDCWTREPLGQALHAVQDFYAHSSWVDQGHRKINEQLGVEFLYDPLKGAAPCPSKPYETKALTSGFYFGANSCDVPDKKCLHGPLVNPSCNGISKDRPNGPYPKRHDVAAGFAVENTRVVVARLATRLQDHKDALARLFGMGPSFGLAVDTSLEEGMAEVRAAIREVLRRVGETGNPPEGLFLTSFGEASRGDVRAAADAGHFARVVDDLEAVGGQEGERAWGMTALARTLARVAPGTRVALLTDGPPKDVAMAGHTAFLAAAKGIPVDYVAVGREGRNASFAALAAATGGMTWELTDGGLDLLPRILSQGFPEWSGLALSRSARIPKGLDTVVVPIDGAVTRARFVVSAAEASGFVVRRPSGAVVDARNADASLAASGKVRFVEIEHPDAGEWRVEVQGSGKYDLQVAVDGPLRLATLLQAEGKLVGPHWGLFGTARMPRAGETQRVVGALDGAWRTARLVLLSAAGERIGNVWMHDRSENSLSGDLVGDLRVPDEPFRVAAEGIDEEGTAFRRVFPFLYRPQAVTVELVEGGPTCRGEGRTPLRFVVTNHGRKATFEIAVSEEGGLAVESSRRQLRLAKGESRTVTAVVDALDSGSGVPPISVCMTATDQDDVTRFNGAVQVLPACNDGWTCPTGTRLEQAQVGEISAGPEGR